MKWFLFLILIGFAGLIYFGFTQTSYAITLGMSSEQILQTQEIIILGHIDSVDLKLEDTEYTVNVLEYVKTPQEFDKKEAITAIGCPQGQRGGCHIFNKGENVLFAINEENDVLRVSEVSFVAPNSNCKVNDFFALHDAKDGLETIQNNQTKKFFTGRPIDITFYASNRHLDDNPYKVTIEFFSAFNNTVFSKTFEGQFEECIPNIKLETAFTPTEMGKYGKRYDASYGGGEMVWGFPIIDQDATPLKQFKAGIPENEIQCKNNLVLMQSINDFPACVTFQTGDILVKRGWATCDDGISHGRGHPCGPRSSPGIVEFDEDYCGKWCNQKELYQLGCNQQILEHISKYTNLLDDDFDGIIIRNEISLPDGISEEKYQECINFILEQRHSLVEIIAPTIDDFRETLSKSNDIGTIFSKFGEPHKDIGSGIHIYVYELEDSTQVWIGYTDHILYARHVDSDGNILEKLFGENEN